MIYLKFVRFSLPVFSIVEVVDADSFASHMNRTAAVELHSFDPISDQPRGLTEANVECSGNNCDLVACRPQLERYRSWVAVSPAAHIIDSIFVFFCEQRPKMNKCLTVLNIL